MRNTSGGSARKVAGIPTRLVLPLIVVALATGCSRGGAGDGTPATLPASLPGSTTQAASRAVKAGWIAVFQVASDPNDLDAKTAELVPLLGTAIRTSPVQCFRGLPAAAGGGYLVGAIAGTKDEMRGLESEGRAAPAVRSARRRALLRLAGGKSPGVARLGV